MRFASLGSGSKGNSTVVESDTACVMVDCGFGLRNACTRLERIGKSPEDLTAIIVTHEHSDHWKGIGALSAKYNIPVYLSAGSLKAKEIQSGEALFNCIDSHKDFYVGDICIKPVPVPHDAREPIQYILSNGKVQLGILTDLGHFTPHVVSSYSKCDALLLECNYDDDMLLDGPYPRFLKDRVSGMFGHLSNRQAADLLLALDLSRLKTLVIGHISAKNNDVSLIKAAIEPLCGEDIVLSFADQESGSPWMEMK
ncbi:MBL fold metallo-hydrolase [Porticoccaceae bacterium]|jgi:phosphoribosyl 1,2-cyclic phosphodiesterase|nr:MBL fold metallo-hydrolase [Porticoccaceae bacterium]MBT7947381.1 MBL fold metallo-hydrolase [Porticoccaceae bacterium]MDC0370740.1 MBL fold metallo-hydrolase [Porticoccaceae bacterium]MDC3200820.1 MBL fold metallo-hydrolase [Porticoccaceae bacterium]